MAEEKIRLQIRRQSGPKEASHWEEFEVRFRRSLNVIAALRDIAENPVTRDGTATTPVSYEANCLEEVCGACAMLVNGYPRQACSALVEQLEQPVRLAPLAKFPVVRDLVVDRSFMFESLKRTKCWIPVDGTYPLGEGPKMAPDAQERAYPLSRCITCGNCLEICPKVNDNSPFMGAAIMSQVRLFNMHPTGAMHARERLVALMGEGGIQGCDNAQNCVKVCPKGIPLTESLADINGQVVREVVRGLLQG
jgi:succinate dehydrogenase iron-sulfur subunit